MDDWGDIPEETRMQRRATARQRQAQGISRDQRFTIAMAVTAAMTLVLGVVIGFAIGRASAPKPPAAPVVAETVATEATSSAEPTEAVFATTETVETTPAEPAVDKTPPKTPRQLAPDDGDRFTSGDRVTLRWSKVTDPSGTGVTYAFEIQTLSGGKWGSAQVIDKLTSTSYKARVLLAKRRWRVWAVDTDGNASPKSDWSTYSGKAPVVPRSKPSTNTTAH